MRHSFNHVVTTLVPELLGEDAVLNETAEIERRALEERRTSPRYVRGEGGEEEGLRQVQVLEGVQGLPPGGRVRAGVGHGELTRAVQGRG